MQGFSGGFDTLDARAGLNEPPHDLYEESIGQMNLAAAGYDRKSPTCAISPHAYRINFETQQIMAIHLVESLVKQKVIPEGSHVAVIGGGLSGVTAAASLLEKGFEVTIIEKNSEYFHKQRKSSHRFIHPSVSFWPTEPLYYTTNLPRLNWFADTCDRVIEQISAEWEQIIDKYAGQYHAELGVMYQDICNKKFHPPPEKSEFDIHVTDPSGVKPDTLHGFNFLIDCTGFASEGTLPGVPFVSYWEFRNPTGSELAICGSGDGGLIEAIMHVFDMRMERIVEIAHDLDSSDIIDGLRKAEMEERLYRFVKDNSSKIMSTKSLPKAMKKAKLITDKKDIYTQNTAPIHRILVCLAKVSEHLEAFQDCVLEPENKISKQLRNKIAIRTSRPKKFRIRNLSSNNSTPLSPNVEIVVRIGPEKVNEEKSKSQKKDAHTGKNNSANADGSVSQQDGMKKLREFARRFNRDAVRTDHQSGREIVLPKAVEAIYRWLDHQRIAKPRSLDIQCCDNHFEVLSMDPEIQSNKLPGELFGIKLKTTLELPSVDDLPYAE